MTSPATGAGTEPRRGRNRVKSRAIRSIVSAVTAEELGIDPSRVGVGLTDRNGVLAITVKTPVSISPLTPSQTSPKGGTLLERSAAAQRTIAERVATLTGTEIGELHLKLSGANLKKERRVK